MLLIRNRKDPPKEEGQRPANSSVGGIRP
jgi:hypothetical protein